MYRPVPITPNVTAWLVLAVPVFCAAGPRAATAPAATAPAATAPAAKDKEPYDSITNEDIASIDFDDATDDEGFVGPLAHSLDHLDADARKRIEERADKLLDWRYSDDPSVAQRVRYCICAAALADLFHDEFESETAYVVFDYLKKEIPKEQLKKACAWIILKPDAGKVVTTAPDLGIEGDTDEGTVRERSVLYAKKLLGRLVGKLPPKE
jgi:hypothetical protein